MLSSIPTKVAAWLDNIGIPRAKGTFNRLDWRIKNNEGVSILMISGEGGDDLIQIDWNGPPGEIHSVRTNLPWIENISANLDKFVALERAIYDQLEELEELTRKSEEAERNLQALQASRG